MYSSPVHWNTAQCEVDLTDDASRLSMVASESLIDFNFQCDLVSARWPRTDWCINIIQPLLQ